MTRRSGIFGAGPEEIETFKRSWPCHGFPDSLNCIIAWFDGKGDLVLLEAFDNKGHIIETESFDGSALAAIVSDIQENGYVAMDGLPEEYLE